MQPLVLAIPTYNSARYLPETLRSLAEQGGHVRWWLQDGQSSDETVAIAESFARSEDTVVSEPDGGQADALNRAISRMGGEIIGFLNGDDCLLPDAARTVVEYFDAHPEVDIVCGQIQWIDERSDVTGIHTGAIQSLEEVLDIYRVWWRSRQWVQPEVFYRRSLWERVGGFNSSYELAFDYDFWVRCFQTGARVAHLAQALAQFRKHTEQKSTAAERAAAEIREIVLQHLGHNPRIPLSLLRRLKAQLSYDTYRTGHSVAGGETPHSFARALLSHPEWLLLSNVRERISVSLRERMAGSTSGTAGKSGTPRDIGNVP